MDNLTCIACPLVTCSNLDQVIVNEEMRALHTQNTFLAPKLVNSAVQLFLNLSHGGFDVFLGMFIIAGYKTNKFKRFEIKTNLLLDKTERAGP